MSYLPFISLANYGDPVRDVANVTDHNRVANILNDIQGVGCRIEKPVNGNGRGWKIIVGDGSSDIDTTDLDPDFLPPDYRRIKKILDAMGGSSGDPINKTFSALSTSASFDELLDDSEDYRGRVIECDVKQIPAGDSAELTTPNWRTYIVIAAPSADVDLATDSPYTVYVDSATGALRIKASSAVEDWAVIWVRASARYCGPCSCPCESWPPETWPCNDLAETYHVTGTWHHQAWSSTDCSGTRYINNTVELDLDLGASPTESCTWTGTQGSLTVRLSLNTMSCRWSVEVIADFATTEHSRNAELPPGSYLDDGTGCVAEDEISWSVETSNVEVSEAAP